MLNFSISLLPVIVVAVANFFVSWLYYSPPMPWFKAWLIGIGADPEKREMTEEDKKAMPGIMIGAAASSLLISYGLQVLVGSLGAVTFLNGAVIGAFLWLIFSVTHSLNSRFEGRKPVVLVINSVLYLLTYAVFGGILAVWS